MKRAIVIGILLLTLTSLVSPQQYFLNVWVDRGCGGNYKIGEKIMTYYNTNAYWSFEVTIWERRPDGRRLKLLDKGHVTGCPCNYGYVIQDNILGRRTVEVELYSYNPALTLTNVCDFNVVETSTQKGILHIHTKDQDGFPLPSVTMLLDGADEGKTDALGGLSIEDVSVGSHTLDAVFGGGRETQTVFVSGSIQDLNFLFSVKKEGRVTIVVKNSKGAPLSEAQIFMEGNLVGMTDNFGMLSVVISAGSHIMLAKKSGIEKSVAISVAEGQMLTTEIELDVGGKTAFFIHDKDGKPLSQAQLFVDNALVGMTDANGTLEAEITPGSHFITTLKEGYDDMRINVIIEPDRPVDIAMSESVPYLMYISLLVVILLLLLTILVALRRRRAGPSVQPIQEMPQEPEEKGEEPANPPSVPESKKEESSGDKS